MLRSSFAYFNEGGLMAFGFLLFFLVFLGVFIWTFLIQEKSFYQRLSAQPLNQEDEKRDFHER